MINLGTVRPGRTIYIPFESFASSTGAPITITGLATSDIQVYKDGGTTQRASASGYTLLDTDGIDFDGITGIHGFSIDLSDNTTADFWQAGSRYIVVVSAVTVDSQTMSFIAATFSIGYDAAVLNTFIATLTNQTSFTLNAGPAEDNALAGMWVAIHDAASAVQYATAVISAYTGSTKTVTLAAAPTFTIAAKDNFCVMGPAPLQPTTAGRTADVDASGGVEVGSFQTGAITNGAFAAGAIDASAIAADAIGSSELAASAVTEIQSGLSTLDAAGVRAAVGLASANLDTQLTAIDDYIDTEVAAIKAKTDQLTFTTPNQVDASVSSIGTGAISAASFAAGAIDAAAIAADAIGSSELAASAVTEIQSGLSTLDAAGVRTAVGLASANLDTQLSTIAGYIDTEVAAILAAVDTEVAAIKAKTDNLPASPAATSDIPTVSQIWTTALTEAYRATGATGTAAELLYEILQNITEFAIASTTKTVKKLDGSTTAKVYTLDSATSPTSITETS